MENNENYEDLADEGSIMKTKDALEKAGINVYITENGKEAKELVKKLIPKNEEVFDMPSVTLFKLELDKLINESGEYSSLRKSFLDDKNGLLEKKKIGGVQPWVIGSIHAVTEQGQILIASATGSQLPSYAYGANNVIWVVGTQKIVKDMVSGLKRIYEYVFPLEDERAKNTYGTGSGVNKLLIINKETIPGRLNLIFVKEKLGF